MTRAADYDFLSLDPATIADPFAFFELVRKEGPVWEDPHTGVYYVSGHADLLEATKNTESLSSINSTLGIGGRPTLSPGQTPDQYVVAAASRPVAEGGTLGDLVRLDPPHHTNFRILVSRLFTARRIAELDPMVRTLARDLLGQMLGSGETDLVEYFSRPLAFLSICDLLGVPEEYRALLAEYSSIAPKMGTPEGAVVHQRRHATMQPIFEELVRARRVRATDDHMSAIANATNRDGSLPTVEEVATMSVTLFGAGLETTARTLTSMVGHLAQRSGDADALRAVPGDIPHWVDEFMRFQPTVKTLFRYATRDTTVGGRPIPAGSVVAMLYGAGSRDPAKFPQPDTFDLGRANSHEHLNFGHGQHYCIGHSLALLELKVGLETLLAGTREIRLTAGRNDLSLLPSYILHALNRLHVDLEPA